MSEVANPNARRDTALSLLSGGVAGAVSRTATSPLERLKVMKQVQSTSHAYDGLFRALAKMWREEGPLSYWKGNGTNIVRIAPHSAIQFFTFDTLKEWVMNESTDSASLRTVKSLACGAVAGATASTVCYPLDLARSCLTVQTTSKQYNGIMHCLKSIHASDGVVGLYRGLPATLMGIAPFVAINFTVFDSLKRNFLPCSFFVDAHCFRRNPHQPFRSR